MALVIYLISSSHNRPIRIIKFAVTDPTDLIYIKLCILYIDYGTLMHSILKEEMNVSWAVGCAPFNIPSKMHDALFTMRLCADGFLFEAKTYWYQPWTFSADILL